MARGRRALAAETHKLRGNAGKRNPPVEAPISAPSADLISAPGWLKKLPKAMKIWNDEAVPILRQLSFIRLSDRNGLARWCYWLAVFNDATQALKKHGSEYQEVKTVSGDMMLREHPAMRSRWQAERLLQSLEASLGLTPKRRLEITSNLALGGGGGSGDSSPERGNESGESGDTSTLGRPKPMDFLRVFEGGKSE